MILKYNKNAELESFKVGSKGFFSERIFLAPSTSKAFKAKAIPRDKAVFAITNIEALNS
jgi:hypothetical protein